MNFGHIKNIHFVGIGGIGMSGIAEILMNYDLTISGCDLKSSATTDRLLRAGVRFVEGHDPSHVDGADLVVVSSAVHQENPEVMRARELGIRVIRRAEMLGEIMRLRKAVAVAGTHGKTTTSAMNSTVLTEAGLDPTVIVGGVLRDLDTNARLGKGEYLVVEADEYDRSFLAFDPTWAVITNIEADHLDCYKDLDDIREAFFTFASKVPFFGSVIGCVDDSNVASLMDRLETQKIAYGLSEAAQLRAVNLRFNGVGTTYEVIYEGKPLGTVELLVPGDHNVRNSLAAIGVALQIGVPFDVAARGLSKFRGVERRFQVIGEYNGAVVVDDYAHHPTEIRATIQAARSAYPGRRLVALFQPHLFSRTRDFYADFAEALSGADVAMVTKIYPAREEPIEGVTSDLILNDAASRGFRTVSALPVETTDAPGHFRRMLKANDVFVTMGAGDVHRVGEAIVGEGR
jgi:UDP-N-acetylmuramate--alanine ligase